MNLHVLKPLLLPVFGLCLAAAMTLALTGCSTVAQTGLDYTTRKIIERSGASVSLDGVEIELAAHVETQAKPAGSGALVAQLKASSSWPKGWLPTQFSFRPQESSESYSYVELDAEGVLFRAIGKDGVQPKVEVSGATRVVRLQLTRLAQQPYELLVTLRNADGRRANLAVRSISLR